MTTKDSTMTIKSACFAKIFAAALSIVLLSSCGNDEKNTADIVQSHLERSLAYEQQGQLRAAIIEARNIIKKDQANPAGYQRLAEIQVKTGSFKAAINTLNQVKQPTHQNLLLLAESYAGLRKYTSMSEALEKYKNNNGDTTNSDYQLMRIKALAGQKKTDEAIANLSTLIANDSKNTDAQILLSTLYFGRQQYDKANQVIDQIFSHTPDQPEALFLASQISYYKNDLDLAEKQLTSALLKLPQTDIMLPMRSRVLSQLSQVLTEQGRTAEALIYSRLIAEANPEASEAKSKFNQALELLQSGDVEQAEVLLQELSADYPNNDLSSLYLGLISYQKGDFASADNQFSDHVDLETASPKLIETTALAKLRVSKTKEAFEILKTALKTHPNNEQLLTIFGVAALNTEDQQEEGVLALEKAIALNPNKIRARLTLARYYLRNNQTERGIAQLQAATKQNPTNLQAITAYAQVMAQTGNQQAAEKAINELIEKQPNNANAHNLKGSYALSIKNITAAKQSFKQSLKLDNNNEQAITVLANIALREKDSAAALSYYEKLITLTPTNPNAYKGLVAAYEVSNKAEAGLNALKGYIKTQQGKTTIPAAVTAEYHLRKNQLDQAAAYLDTITSGAPSNYQDSVYSATKYALAQAAANSQDWEKARAYLLQAIEKTPDNQVLYNYLIGMEIKNNRLKEAEDLINTVSVQFPDSVLATMAKSQLLIANKKTTEASDLLHQHWDKTPNDTIAESIIKLEGPATNQELLSQWQEYSPNNPLPIIMTAMNAQQTGGTLQAITLYEKANELGPNNPTVLNNLAWLYFETGNNKAIKTAEMAYKLAPENTGIMDTYGWILVQNNQKNKGVEILTKAVELSNGEIAEIVDHLKQAETL